MSRFFAAAVAASFAFLSLTPATAQTPRSYERIYEALWSAVNDNFYDPHFRGADWAGARDRYRDRARAARTDEDFVAVANAMLEEIGTSHLYVTRPADSAARTGIGARFSTIGEELIVTEVAAASDAHRQGLRVGDRLLSERAALYGEIGSTAAIRIRACDAHQRALQIRREQAFWPPEHPGFRWSQIRTGPSTRIGYMRIDRFDDGAAELADRAMEELAEAQAIIIDVRNNSGGNVSALRLASYFGPGAEPAFVLLARPYLQALGHPVTVDDIRAAPRVSGAYTTEAVFKAMSQHNGGAAFWSDAVERRFTGPVFVLIGPDTGSAAEGFAWYMRERTHARLIGQRTAGALLSSDRFDIGDGWRVIVPVHGNWGTNGEDYADRAVPPHEEIGTTRADLCAGRDRVLDAALQQALKPRNPK
jgi:carboxyl-terminal processing protease